MSFYLRQRLLTAPHVKLLLIIVYNLPTPPHVLFFYHHLVLRLNFRRRCLNYKLIKILGFIKYAISPYTYI